MDELGGEQHLAAVRVGHNGRLGGNVTWLVYNITNWLRGKVLGQRTHCDTTLALRCELIALPAKLVSNGR